MIHRHVYFRFAHVHSGTDALKVAVHETHKLAKIDEIKSLRILTPADDSSRAAWDLCLQLEFESLAGFEAYRVHPLHRAYVDGFLKPRLQVIKAWNFEETT